MKKIGIAIIGASMRSGMLFSFLRRNPDYGYISGIFDILPQRGQYMLHQYGVSEATIYPSLQEAVGDRRTEAVFIGTPDYAHAEPVVAALAAGKHVFCEKPIATTLEDCQAMVSAATAARSVFYVGKNLRHCPVYKKMHQLLDEGKLGKLLTIEANEYYYNGRTYFRRWNRLEKFSGGLWITKACHDFDLLNWFAGGAPRTVYAVCQLSYYKPKAGAGPYCRVCRLKQTCPDFYDIDNPIKSHWCPEWDDLGRITEQATGQMRDLCLYNSDKDTFDNGIAVVEYDNDVRATYTVNVVSARSTRQMRLMGTDGSAESDMEMGKVKYWKRHTTVVEEYDLSEQMNASSHGGADDEILKDFFDCCRTGRKPQSGWFEGRLALQVGLAARQSYKTGEVVRLGQER